MKEFLLELLQAMATAAVPVCAAFLIQFLRRKSKQLSSLTDKELLAEITDAVATAVAFTSQTYVDALKKGGEFTKEAQAKAAQKAFKACCAALSAEAVAFIETHYGDFTKYLTTKIEAEVRAQKLA